MGNFAFLILMSILVGLIIHFIDPIVIGLENDPEQQIEWHKLSIIEDGTEETLGFIKSLDDCRKISAKLVEDKITTVCFKPNK